MKETRISIGRAKRDFSELVTRVKHGGERILLTSRGRPEAAIVSLQDYELLEREKLAHTLASWEAWVAESDRLAADILARREGRPPDVDSLWQAARAGLEDRDAETAGR